ncbi:hypothetical protein BS47DRAFT_1390669 [Hydnum rufescens UP504]|uniref:Uncharacterized protein n=1 Tax=Hydnum rufescens UP504 TaxID=1448309 RepID=A0A9P6B2L1_9AGAM|nr:hypothetical protein BS47DRAFT_1390669 [Hydnum rufescens UP504]
MLVTAAYSGDFRAIETIKQILRNATGKRVGKSHRGKPPRSYLEIYLDKHWDPYRAQRLTGQRRKRLGIWPTGSLTSNNFSSPIILTISQFLSLLPLPLPISLFPSCLLMLSFLSPAPVIPPAPSSPAPAVPACPTPIVPPAPCPVPPAPAVPAPLPARLPGSDEERDLLDTIRHFNQPTVTPAVGNSVGPSQRQCNDEVLAVSRGMEWLALNPQSTHPREAHSSWDQRPQKSQQGPREHEHGSQVRHEKVQDREGERSYEDRTPQPREQDDERRRRELENEHRHREREDERRRRELEVRRHSS